MLIKIVFYVFEPSFGQSVDSLQQMPEYCQGVDEESVNKSAFELIFAFDEVISLGYRENVNLQHIRTYTEMESHEEKLANMIMQVCRWFSFVSNPSAS